jgi:CheY-like chemotaxis protein
MILADATVLIVDDEPELLEIFATWLGRNGCKVLTAVNGAEALKVLASEQVHALISDIRMPIMDGVTLIRRLYEMKIRVPSIIFVSGFGDVDVREMHALGVEALLSKPLSRKSLLDALESSLKDRQDLWLEPVAEGLAEAQTVTLELDSLAEATVRCEFSIGRGGCCFACERPLLENQLIWLTIRFARDARTLHAQGKVRWYSAHDARCGMQFIYLDAGCRAWVLDGMKGSAAYHFIPSCGSM